MCNTNNHTTASLKAIIHITKFQYTQAITAILSMAKLPRHISISKTIKVKACILELISWISELSPKNLELITTENFPNRMVRVDYLNDITLVWIVSFIVIVTLQNIVNLLKVCIFWRQGLVI